MYIYVLIEQDSDLSQENLDFQNIISQNLNKTLETFKLIGTLLDFFSVIVFYIKVLKHTYLKIINNIATLITTN